MNTDVSDFQKNEFRVFGPPGCGKTTQLSEKVTEECEKNGSELVVVSSFTRTAAQELVARNLPLDRSQIGTLHALCYRLLGQPPLVEKRSLLDEWNRLHPYMAFHTAKDQSLDDPYGDSEPGGLEDFNAYKRYRARQVPRESWRLTVSSFAEKWEAFKNMTGTMDFTDLIENCLDPEMPPHEAATGFFDEVQDFSPLELALVRKWASHMDHYYLAGDDDQCCYHFKGSVPDSFLYPELPPEQKIILSQSYRLPRAIHHKAVEWVRHIQPREPKEYFPRDAEGLWGGVGFRIPILIFFYLSLNVT